MQELLFSTMIAITLIAVLDSLISKTKNGVLVKKVVALTSISIILIPICTIIANEDFSYNYENTNVVFANYLQNLEINLIKNGLTTKLESQGCGVEYVEISTGKNNGEVYIEKITIKLRGLVITENNEHIHIVETAIKIVNEYVKNDKVEVIIET